MSDSILDTLILLYLYFTGLLTGWIIWAPSSVLKDNIIDGLSFKFIWSRFIKSK